MNTGKKSEMIEPKAGSTLTEKKNGMKKVINGKTYNTSTSKKVCSYAVNKWNYELYQTKTGEYFTYIHDKFCIMEKLYLVPECEMRHMLERSGVEKRKQKVTVLKELGHWICWLDEEVKVKVTGEGGFVNFDFGSWEITVDIDDEEWARLTLKGKTIFNQDDLNMIEHIRGSYGWYESHDLNTIRREYLKERFGDNN